MKVFACIFSNPYAGERGLAVLPTIDVFGFHIAMYGLMILCGAAAGIIAAVLRSGITGLKRDDLVYASLYGAIGTAVGAKLMYIITVLPDIVRNFRYLTSDWNALSAILTGGFVFYGGFLGGALAIWIYCRQYKLGFFPMIEALTPSIPLIHAFGRLGCFFAGCCYGIEYPPL
jgi:phosphatidylglycerol:prolipoprotein diacylglycerol transferase